MNEATAVAAEPIGNVTKVKIIGMDCGSCAMTIEDSMRAVPGVESASVSFTTETMEVAGDVLIDDIEDRLRKLGYRIAGEEDQRPADLPERHGASGFMYFMWEQPPLRRALMVTLAVLAGIAIIPAIGIGPVAGIPVLTILFGTAVLVAGAPVFFKGFRSLIFGRRVTIDLLMAIAAFGAIGIGETGEAVTIILLFMLGEGLEAYSAERARDSLRSLMSLQPQEATVLEAHAGEHGHDHDSHDHDDHNNNHDHVALSKQHGAEQKHDEHAHDHDQGHAHEHNHEHSESCSDHDHEAHDHGEEPHDHQIIKPVDQVNVGDRVLVRPGQRIPVDGDVIKGISSVNQAPVTGEDMPILKEVGDEVMAGTVNGEAALEIKVTRPSSEGTIARIARLVEQAQAERSPAERFIDRFARYYTPAVVVLATLVVAIPVLMFNAPFLDTADGTHGWLYRGLTLLIIACPCALVISIPVTVVSGLTRLAQLGVLVKSGALLDRMADVQIIAFDKTGTLTYGKPKVSGMRTADCAHEAELYDDCTPCDDVVVAAASVERASEHPVAHAIVAAAGNRSGTGHISVADDVQAHPGKGVSGVLKDGEKIAVGSAGLFTQQEEGWGDVAPHADNAQQHGQTIMYVSRNDKVVGYIGVQDEIRKDSIAALAELGNMNPPIRRVMLTGDNAQSAARVASQIPGIDEVHAGLLPDEKLREIEKLHSDDMAVAMVGDGINDAPALARADIGIAMGGGGTAQAMETADVVLMQDDLSHVALALRMARKARQIIKQNIMLSLALKLAFLALAIPGIATLWMAVLADVGATLLVTLNGMRLLRQS
ncbi:MAG: heavy metal translocating P-type ATPase [Gammaproteobacteria bacterium]|nr:heavy metal translocating P-type ATPase [Gammaproteobacteria bacterium]